jgi:hypothetical protein
VAKRHKKCKNNRPNRYREKRERAPKIRNVVFREYYQLAFCDFNRSLSESGAYKKGPSLVRREFWLALSPGPYSPEVGRKLVKDYLSFVEEQLCAAVRGNSIAFWLHVFRRLAPTAIGTDVSPTTVLLTRQALEAAVQKCAPAALCGGVGMSNAVLPSEVLGGYLVAHGDTVALKGIADYPQLVLTDFGCDELLAVLEAEKLAYEVWWAMALLRILGKGASLIVTGNPHDPARDGRSNELDFLVRHYDRRSRQFSVTATATVFADAFKRFSGGVVFLPRYNVERIPFSRIGPILETFFKRPFQSIGNRGSPNFVWMPFDIASFYKAHRPFSGAFANKHGVAMESVIAVIAAIAHGAFRSWVYQPELFLLRSWQRAYEGPLRLTDYEMALTSAIPTVVHELGLEIDTATVSVRDAVEWLTLRESKLADIDIGYSGPHYVFLPCGEDRVFVDLAHLMARLYLLFHGVNLADQNFKGEALETLVRGRSAVLPKEELFGHDGTSRQIDAAFAAGDILVIAECRANARSIAFDRGEPEAIARRREVVEKALDDIDEKAQWLKRHPNGTRHDIRGYRAILPVGVTPFDEFIPSRAPRYWIDSWLPRVLTPDELLDALEHGTLARALKDCPNVLPLR